MSTTKRPFIIKSTAAIILAAVAYWGFNQVDGESAKANTVYEVKTTDRGNITQSVSASGSVRPLITVEIGSQLSGQIEALYADYNDEVAEGALLARIDPQTYETSVKQADAQLAVALASVKMQKATIERAEAILEEAERQVKRQEELRRQGTIAESTLDTAISSHKTALADLTSAKASLQNAEATVAQRQASLDQAKIDLNRTEIRSPINGTVIERSVDVGQTVAASLSAPTLFELAQDLSEIQVEADVDEADIGTVESGNRVEFTVDAYPERTFAGNVKQIRLSPDESSNVVTYTVIITAQNSDRALLPGMTANVEIFTGEKPQVVRVDNSALRFRPSEGAEIIEPERPERRGGQGQMMTRLVEELELDDDQQDEILKAMTAMRPQRTERESGGSQGIAMGPPQGETRTQDRVQMRQRMEAMRDKVFRSVLTDLQWAKYEELKKEQAEVRRAQVWVLTEDEKLQPARVLLGLSDDDFTEVIRGLEPGTQVVVRETKASK